MGYETRCRKCYGTGKRWGDYSPTLGDFEEVPCVACGGRGIVKPYRIALTIDAAQGLGWDAPELAQPRFGRKGHCQVCDVKLTGRRWQFCSGSCNFRLYRRLYLAHWQKRAIAWRDGWGCRVCGEVMESTIEGSGGNQFPDFSRLELDHVIALHLGGDESAGNCQLLCYECHKEKTKAERRLQLPPASVLGRSLWG